MAIFSQSVQPLEIIVVDDASTDDSVRIIKDIIAEYPHARLVCHSTNRGVLETLEHLRELARGEYILAVAADDKVLPGIIEQATDLLQRYPQAGLCFSDPQFFDGSGREWTASWGVVDTPTYLSPEQLKRILHERVFQVTGHTSVVKRELMEYQRYAHLKWYHDWFVLHLISLRHGACYVPRPLSSMRQLPSSYSAAGKRDRKAHISVLRAVLDELEKSENADVADYFRHSLLMCPLVPEVVNASLLRPVLWDFAIPMTLLTVRVYLHRLIVGGLVRRLRLFFGI